MKTKLMLSAFVAALALVSCNKNDTTPVVDNSLKSVKLSLENAVMTKGPAGDKITAGDAVQVGNIKIILTDGAYSPAYSAQNANGDPAQTYFTAEEIANGALDDLQFHYVDHKCNKVVVVANAGDISITNVKNLSTPIAQQQDQKSLILLAEADLNPTGRQHINEETGKHTDVYEAALTLKPTIARFEIDGFRVNWTPDNPDTPEVEGPKFNSIEVTDIAFQNYYPHLAVSVVDGFSASGAGTVVHHVDPANLENEADVYAWLNTTSSGLWYRDAFTGLEMTPADPAVDLSSNLAYHFYVSNVIPTMVIKLLADGTPAYIYADEYKTAGGASITSLNPGYIYRMSAAGDVNADGSVLIPDDLDPMQRCLDITIEVIEWTVELITPQF